MTWRPVDVDATERLAGDTLARLLGASAVPHDDGSVSAMYDVTLCFDDGTFHALEVTRHADEAVIGYAKSDVATVIDAADMGGYWWVRVRPSANRKRLVRELPVLLPGFPEDLADMRLIRQLTGHPKQSDAARLDTIGVEWATFKASAEASKIVIVTGAAGMIHPDVSADAALTEVEPNRAKLAAATDAKARHLFVWIDSSAAMAHTSMRDPDDGVPTVGVDLGHGIDVLWVGLEDVNDPSRVARLWRVTSAGPWEDWSPRLGG